MTTALDEPTVELPIVGEEQAVHHYRLAQLRAEVQQRRDEIANATAARMLRAQVEQLTNRLVRVEGLAVCAMTRYVDAQDDPRRYVHLLNGLVDVYKIAHEGTPK